MTALPQGFRLAKSLLGRDDIERLRSAVNDSIDRVARSMLTPYETSCPGVPLEERLERVADRDRAYASALWQVVMADAQRDPRLADLPRHPALAAVISDVLAPATPSGFILRTRTASRAFSARISPWHQDVVRPDEKTGCARVRLACWIPLADVEEGTGALELISAAAQQPLPHVMRDDGHFEIPAEALPAGEQHVIAMRAGDVLLLDRFVTHRARPVQGLRARWAVVMWVKAGGTTTC
jgi:hypothetical protein